MNKLLKEIITDLNGSYLSHSIVSEGLASTGYIVRLSNNKQVFVKTNINKDVTQKEVKVFQIYDWEKVPNLIDYSEEEPCYIVTEYYPEKLEWSTEFIENFIISFGKSLKYIHNTQLPIDSYKNFFMFKEKEKLPVNKYKKHNYKIKKYLNERSFKTVFIHSDVNFGNLRLYSNGKINVYLDWESAGYGPIYHDISKAESMIEILLFYVDYPHSKAINLFRKKYGLTESDITKLELWKYIRHYTNYERFKQLNGVHYDFGVSHEPQTEIKQQKQLLDKQYERTKYIIS